MGGRGRVVVVDADGEPALLDAAERRLAELERRWTRFDAGSEVRRLVPGHPTLVSDDTVALVEAAIAGWEATGGLFDPTVHDAVVAAGYDRPFEQLDRHRPSVRSCRPVVPGCGDIHVDPVAGTVTLPLGAGFDPGGIGKGLAADIVAGELCRHAPGALVELGGDVRVAGQPPDGDAWRVAVDDPRRPGATLDVVHLMDGAVATTGRHVRRWRGGHHVIDPRTGRPAAGDVLAATVVAGQAWVAEVFATALFLAGAEAGAALLDAAGLAGLAVTLDGSLLRTAGWEAFLR